MRVLVVEDQALIALTFGDALAAAGHEVIGPASTSAQGLELIREQLPDIAFVDVDLESKGAGLRVARELASRNVPVVFTTGQPDRVRHCGMGIGLLPKPYDLRHAVALVPHIRALMEGRGGDTGLPATFEVLAAGLPNQDHVLLVEDHRNDIELTVEALNALQSGAVIVARDGQEALDQLQCSASRDSRLPLFMLLDLKMPRLDGAEVLKRVKQDPQLRSLPIIVFTSSREDADLRQCYENGANAVIRKPLDPRDFKRALSAITRFWGRRNVSPRKGLENSFCDRPST